MNKKKWTNGDTTLLIDLYPISTDNELIKAFNGRTLTSIKVKAKKMKLKKTKEAEFKNRSNATSGEKNGMFGKDHVLKNKTYDDFYGLDESEQIKKKLSDNKKENYRDISGDKNPMFGKIPYNKGHKMSQEIKNFLSKKAIERYKNLSDDEKEKRKKIWFEKVFSKKYDKNKRTKPELIFENLLNDLGVDFIPQTPVNYYLVDYTVNKLAFEIHGDYWHGNPLIFNNEKLTKTQIKNINRDKRKKICLEKCGYTVFYFWEFDLIKNNKICQQKLKEILDATS
jgi:G:T-mismatch repair DNA endonuclease (very short patch repair protein)